MRKSLFLLGLAVASVTPGFAQTNQVIPAEFTSTATTGSFFGPLNVSPRRYQMLISQTELTAYIGQNLTGITWRNGPSQTSAWPAADITYADYTIKVGEGVSPSARTTTFANNRIGAQTTVRTGPLSFNTGVFPIGGSPNDFGPTVVFDTPFLYTGVDLIIELEIGTASGSNRGVEATLATGGPAGLYGTRVSALWTGSLTSATGSQANFAVSRLTFAPAARIEGVVTFSNSDSDWSNEKISIEVVDPNTSTAVTTVTGLSVDATGNYGVNVTTPNGTYDVYIKGDTFLKKVSSGVVFSGGTVTVNSTLTNGDVDNNNEVGPNDFALMSAAFGSEVGDPNYSLAADLDDNGEVGPSDFSILSNNFGLEGDSF